MENKELSGVLFPNTKTNEKHPDYRGKCVIGGVKYRIAGWKRISKADMPYLSILFQVDEGKFEKPVKHTPKQVVAQVSKAVNGPETIVNDEPLVDDLPF